MEMIYLNKVNNTSNHNTPREHEHGNLQLDMILEIVWCIKEALYQLYCLGSIEAMV